MELEPTKENLLATLTRDLLDRNKDVWSFACLCDAQEGRCSIALDAKWGTGKTFFVQHAKMLMESFNPFTANLTDDERNTIQSAFSKIKEADNDIRKLQPEVCVYYDAWANDNNEDPILSIVYEILKSTSQNYSFRIDPDCLQSAVSIADFFTGRNFAELAAVLRGNDLLQEIKNTKGMHTRVAEFLDSLPIEKGDRLVIIIDELDRCKPEYAVLLLERIKHYFANDRITFVFSVNIEELQHTVKRFYGADFDACRYLERFFDFRISLPPANVLNYCHAIGLGKGLYVHDDVCIAFIEKYNFGLREIEKYFRTVKTAIYKPLKKSGFSAFPEGYALAFSLCIVVPVVIGLGLADISLYNKFIEGHNSKPLIDIIKGNSVVEKYCLSVFEVSGNNGGQHTTGLLTDKIEEVYNVLFAADGITEGREISIGKCTFSYSTKQAIFKATSMLSEYADYE